MEPPSEHALSREEMLPLIISQLHAFQLHEIARRLASDTRFPPSATAPSHRLSDLAGLGRAAELAAAAEEAEEEGPAPSGEGGGLSFDGDAPPARPAPNFAARHVSMSKSPLLSAAFSPDGNLLAAASRDGSVRLLSVAKMAAAVGGDAPTAGDDKAVVKLYTEHAGQSNEVAWHPGGAWLASAGEDRTLKFYEIGKNSKKAMKWVGDSHPVRSVSYHPSGDFLVAGTDQGAVRIYDTRNMSCFVPSNPAEGHRRRVNSVRFGPTGAVFASASDEGTIKIFDTVAGRLVNTLEAAHRGRPAWCVRFSRDGRYLVSTGGDSTAKCWDLRSGVAAQTYEGAGMAGNLVSCALTHDERYLLCGDDRNSFVLCWDPRTGGVLRKLSAHSGTVRGVASSPIASGFASYSDDMRLRYWNLE